MAGAMARLQDAAKDRRPLVIPIVLGENCSWKETPLASLQALPQDRSRGLRTVDRWKNRRQAFDAVEQELRRMLKER
jgi:hypothetical protein